jgi:hypothetical protein
MTDQIETLMALADSFAEYRDHNEYVHTRAKLRKALEAALKPVDNEMHREVIAAIGAAGLTLVRAVNGFRLVRLGEITAQAAPPAQTPVEPAMNGWKLVPVEPTDEMLLATIATAGNYTKEQMLAWPEVSETRTNWAAMLDAAPPAQTLCHCKDRPASECPGEWEPGCDLGNNEAHAVAVQTPCQYAADVGMPEYRCVKECQYATQTPPLRLTEAFIQATRETHWRKGELERAIESAVRRSFGVQE